MSLILINVINLTIISIIIYLLMCVIRDKKINIKLALTQNKAYNKLSEYALISAKRNLLPSKANMLNPAIMAICMVVLFIGAFGLFYSYLKVITTSIILSLPFFVSPILIIRILLNREKSNIVRILPMYVVNIKNHISEDNNIVGAIQRTTVEEPLKRYIDIFKFNISRGMNVIEALQVLKEDVNVKVFDAFINSCEVCYLNGGDFNKVLENYIEMITKENVHKESSKEKAYADILTLIIMIILNVLVIVMFVFTNKEYAQIIRETFFGRLILNFNAVSYILIAYFISRIYKEE